MRVALGHRLVLLPVMLLAVVDVRVLRQISQARQMNLTLVLWGSRIVQSVDELSLALPELDLLQTSGIVALLLDGPLECGCRVLCLIPIRGTSRVKWAHLAPRPVLCLTGRRLQLRHAPPIILRGPKTFIMNIIAALRRLSHGLLLVLGRGHRVALRGTVVVVRQLLLAVDCLIELPQFLNVLGPVGLVHLIEIVEAVFVQAERH